MSRLLGFDCEPRDATAFLRPYDGTPALQADGLGRKVFDVPDSVTGGGWLEVHAPGYVSHGEGRLLSMPEFDLPVNLIPLGGELPALHVEGREFVTSQGERHLIIGSTELLLAWRYDLEGPDAIRSVLEERQALGFNNLRVLWQKGPGSNGLTSPWMMPIDKLAPFLALAAEYEFYIQGVILADCQIVLPDVAAQQQRVENVRVATVGITNLIEQLGNEYGKNGFHPAHFSQPTDRLAANASNIEGGPYARPFWDFMCFSGQRHPLNHAIREYGPLEFMYGDVVSGVQIPALCDEGFKPGINSSDPRDYERAGAQARSGAGGRFHSTAGTAGNSCLFTDLERDCAARFVYGMTGR